MRGNDEQQSAVFSYVGAEQRIWVKQVAGMWQTRFRGRRRIEWMFRLAVSALNLRRMQRLLAVATG
jgi:hypothetical protein